MCSVALLLINTLICTSLAGVPSWPTSWDVLGPFPFAYREQGADPLVAFGGIDLVPRADASTYPSEVVNGGRAGWTKANVTEEGVVNIAFSDIVNWDLLGDGVGPSAQLWQGWALGDFSVEHSATYLVQCVDTDFTQTFTQSMIWIDDVLLNGNTVAYTFPWYPVVLGYGNHTIKLKVSGGGDSESYSCRFANATLPFAIIENDDTVPDVIDGMLVSPYLSIPVLNTQQGSFLTGITATIIGENFTTSFSSVSIAPGQILPLNLDLSTFVHTPTCPSWTLTFQICAQNVCLLHNVTLACQTFPDPYMFTFLDFDGAVHYAALKPPNKTCPANGCSILLTVHGCGVQAQSGAWTGAYQYQNTSWILFPTGRREVGFDWEGPGTLNVFSALQYFVKFMPGVAQAEIANYKPDPTRIIFAGHSMGGHGTFNLAGKFPDMAIGVAPAAGWIKWEHYVPYFTRLGDSYSDPYLLSLLYASIAEHDTDFYTPNIVGLPFIVRMGGDDPTVPPWNLRRMSRLIDQLSANPSAVEISEIPGEGHWFNGVVDDAVMQAFFDKAAAAVPQVPTQFSIACMNPATFGSKAGINILQHSIPYRAARIDVTIQSPQNWQLVTENLRRFGISPLSPDRNLSTPSQQISLDGQEFTFSPSSPLPLLPASHFCNLDGGSWAICTSEWTETERNPTNYGPLRQVIEGPVIIVFGTSGNSSETELLQSTAIWLANDLYHTGRYAIQIFRDAELQPATAMQNNLILLGGPTQNLWTAKLESGFPLKFTSAGFQVGPRSYFAPHTGALFLAPWQTQRLAAVIAGNDDTGYWNAFQSFPTHTGHMVPDYQIVGPKFGWAGAGGILAAGFWNNFWEFDYSCGYAK
eukprot:Phypoly_transcript_02444.p1 GENE.Phypoly_transcript_02444~~Phypoly_transcript_02444.p1  ORF type:complete len:863 (+),score=95.22 Phypoly_transcript_02444:156-2744(+)